MPLVNALATHHMRRGSVSQREDLMAWGFSFAVKSAVSHPCLLPDFDLSTPFYRTTALPKIAPKICDSWLTIFSPIIYLWRQWNSLLLWHKMVLLCLRFVLWVVMTARTQGPLPQETAFHICNSSFTVLYFLLKYTFWWYHVSWMTD